MNAVLAQLLLDNRGRAVGRGRHDVFRRHAPGCGRDETVVDDHVRGNRRRLDHRPHVLARARIDRATDCADENVHGLG